MKRKYLDGIKADNEDDDDDGTMDIYGRFSCRYIKLNAENGSGLKIRSKLKI